MTDLRALPKKFLAVLTAASVVLGITLPAQAGLVQVFAQDMNPSPHAPLNRPRLSEWSSGEDPDEGGIGGTGVDLEINGPREKDGGIGGSGIGPEIKVHGPCDKTKKNDNDKDNPSPETIGPKPQKPCNR
ncbi:MAG: hypothetical protein HQ511_06570 [Rhodospirillales bacterium]|nr:hypothetical protein [Rhodospirillales bacterium]